MYFCLILNSNKFFFVVNFILGFNQTSFLFSLLFVHLLLKITRERVSVWVWLLDEFLIFCCVDVLHKQYRKTNKLIFFQFCQNDFYLLCLWTAAGSHERQRGQFAAFVLHFIWTNLQQVSVPITRFVSLIILSHE